MYGVNIETTAAELDYRRERIATDYRHAAAVVRTMRRHLARRTDRQRAF